MGEVDSTKVDGKSGVVVGVSTAAIVQARGAVVRGVGAKEVDEIM